MREVLHQAKNLTAEQTASLCLERVTAWAGAAQQDDLTVIVVDIKA